MRSLSYIVLSLGIGALLGCAVSVPASDEYQLSAFSAKQYTSKPRHITVLVTQPEAAASYQTQQMLYVNKPFQLGTFTKNAWKSPPADMLYPLMIQSLQRTGYFYAVTSSPHNEAADYRLDTQLLKLEQNFLSKPSVIEFSAKIVFTHIDDNRVLGSQIINYRIPCAQDTPYGGVLAANQASERYTAAVDKFIISLLNRDQQ
jgi:cholesterol transport system auxiliary component